MTTKYHWAPADSVSDDMWRAWSRLQIAHAALDSPFLCADFTRAVSRVRSDVQVAWIERHGEAVGFFPFQRHARGIQPVAGRLSECHGAIVAPTVDWSAADLLRACGIRAWHFDHLPEGQVEFEQHAWGQKPSPYIDLRQGFAAYREAIRQRGGTLSQMERKTRKLEREVGPLQFAWHDTSPDVIPQLIEWKSDQHRRTKVLEIFKHDWLRQLFVQLSSITNPEFSGPLATLRAGDRLVAAHLGLCSPTVLHLWFPAYDASFKAYSPGAILLLKLAEAAAARGISRFELGPGEERYKEQFRTADRLVSEGMVCQNRIYSKGRELWFHLKRKIRSSPYRSHLEFPLTATRRLRQWMAFK